VSTVRDMYLRYRQLVHEGFKFLVVGGVGVVITDGGTNLLHGVFKMDWIVAEILATAVAIAFTFLGSRYWTFKHRERTGSVARENAVFWLLAVIGLGIQLGCLGFVTKVLGDTRGLPANVGLLGGIVLATLFRFWSYRKWVWREPVSELLEEEHEALHPENAPLAPASGGAGGLRDDRPGQAS
jgi:putative flippase GtrA